MVREKKGESKEMGSDAMMWKHVEDFEVMKRRAIEEFCQTLYYISVALQKKHGTGYETKMRSYLDKHNIYFDSGIDFKEFVDNICSFMRYDVIGNEYVILDDLQDKRVYVDINTMCKPCLFFDITEEMKGEF